MRLILLITGFLFLAIASSAQKKSSPKKKPVSTPAKTVGKSKPAPKAKNTVLATADTVKKFTPAPVVVPKEKDGDKTTVREADMLQEINSVRTKPKEYKAFVQAYVLNHRADTGIGNAATELMALLDTMRPLPPLKFSNYLYLQAKIHAQWMEDADSFEHSEFNNGENLVGGLADIRQAIVTLLIDARLPGRGHRANILNAGYKFAGIAEAAGTVQGMGHAFVQEFNYKQ